jgi:hypothetical protein
VPNWAFRRCGGGEARTRLLSQIQVVLRFGVMTHLIKSNVCDPI